MKRLLIALILIGGFLYAWKKLEVIPVRVVGQPSMTGPIQSQLEQPFFNELSASTGLPFQVDYRTVDSLGFKDNFQLAMLKEGLYDVVSLRFLQNAREEPSIEGVDLIGLNEDFDSALKTAKAYESIINQNLEQHFGAKLMGIWTFGPQVIMCRPKVASLADLNGLKVRVGSTSLSTLMKSLGATPMVMAFDQVREAFEQRSIDCAVSSLTSAQAAGWGPFIHHVYPISLHMGLNGIAVRTSLWNRLNPSEQDKFKHAVQDHIDRTWMLARKLDHEARDCFEGKARCSSDQPIQARVHPVLTEDVRALRQFVLSHALPEWAKTCDQQRPNCSNEWKQNLLHTIQVGLR